MKVGLFSKHKKKYHLEYLIADDASNNIDVSSGILGHNHGNSNIVIAQELYVPVEIPKT